MYNYYIKRVDKKTFCFILITKEVNKGKVQRLT